MGLGYFKLRLSMNNLNKYKHLTTVDEITPRVGTVRLRSPIYRSVLNDNQVLLLALPLPFLPFPVPGRI